MDTRTDRRADRLTDVTRQRAVTQTQLGCTKVLKKIMFMKDSRSFTLVGSSKKTCTHSCLVGQKWDGNSNSYKSKMGHNYFKKSLSTANK